ncbi:hypothetical protein ACR1PO_09875 [Chryseobacterium sp. RRHN12]|uniref:hypothetical protein n=1 Tax=Chryseobacterium sp. RRHN12 TaxID=3437884 RepID=UPI002FC5CE40
MNNFIVLSKDFAANESAVVDIKWLGYTNPLGALTFRNKTGQYATFIWQREITHNRGKTGYFKEVINDLGVKVNHYDGLITVTNGGGKQYLQGELKI